MQCLALVISVFVIIVFEHRIRYLKKLRQWYDGVSYVCSGTHPEFCSGSGGGSKGYLSLQGGFRGIFSVILLGKEIFKFPSMHLPPLDPCIVLGLWIIFLIHVKAFVSIKACLRLKSAHTHFSPFYFCPSQLGHHEQ